MLLAIFGIDDGLLNLLVSLIVLFLVVVWLALVYWTYLDASRRIEDRVLVGSATTASLFPFVGTIIYVILRPPEYLEEARERELETKAAELRVRQLAEQACPNCQRPIERNFMRCPSCRARLKDPCPSCGEPLDPRWSLCPYCETPVQARKRRPGAREAPAREPAAAGAGSKAATRPARTKRSSGTAKGSEDGAKRGAKSRAGSQRGGSRRQGDGGEERTRSTPAS